MMRTLLVILVLLCGCTKSGSTTPPTGPGPGPTMEPGTGTGTGTGTPMCGAPNQGPITQEQCTCLGGHVKASIGGGDEAHCAPGETEVAEVRFGIEGGWCCKGS